MTTFIAKFVGGPEDGQSKVIPTDHPYYKVLSYVVDPPTPDQPNQFLRLVHHAYELDKSRVDAGEYQYIFYAYIGVCP